MNHVVVVELAWRLDLSCPQVLFDINGAGTGVDVFTTGDHNGGNTLASCTAPVLCMLQ